MGYSTSFTKHDLCRKREKNQRKERESEKVVSPCYAETQKRAQAGQFFPTCFHASLSFFFFLLLVFLPPTLLLVHLMQPRSSKARSSKNWETEFYKNGYPQEVIVIGDTPPPSPAAATTTTSTKRCYYHVEDGPPAAFTRSKKQRPLKKEKGVPLPLKKKAPPPPPVYRVRKSIRLYIIYAS